MKKIRTIRTNQAYCILHFIWMLHGSTEVVVRVVALLSTIINWLMEKNCAPLT